MVQPFADRLWSARGALFTTFLSLLAIWICLMTVRRVLAGSFGLTLPPVDNLSQLVQRPGDAFILTRVAIAEYPWSVFRAWGAGIAASTASVALGLMTLWLLLRREQERTGHGSSKWATRQDIVKAGLLDNEHTGTSLIVGGWSDAPSGKSTSVEYLVYTAPESLTAFAPSGSAKTVALVIPNLLCYESSAFVLDVKGELWEATAGYRQRELKQHVLYHDPSKNDGQGACYNPLEEIQIGHESAVSDVQMLAEYLIPRSAGNSGNAEHFETSARSLIVGVMLHELSRKSLAGAPAANIAGVLSEVSNPVRPFKEYLQDMLDYQAGNPLIAKVIRETASEMLQKEDREFSGVLSSMITPLTKWRDPILAAATAHSDFRIMDLVDRDQGMTLYLTIRPSERDRLKHYFGMFINLLFRKLTEEVTFRGRNRKELLVMLEEFSSMPPLPVVQESMDVMRGFGLKAFIILQDVESLNALYGQNETFTSNSKIQIAYTPSKPKTARLLSEMAGASTVTERTDSQSTRTLALVPSTQSQGESVHARNLLTPDEIMRLSIPVLDEQNRMIEAGTALIFMRGCRPIRAVQTPYFFDPELTRRAAISAPEASDRLTGPAHPGADHRQSGSATDTTPARSEHA